MSSPAPTPPTPEPDHPRVTPAVQALIAVNAAVLFLSLVVFDHLPSWLAFSGTTLTERWWTAITYMFVHAGLLHLAANMYGLYLFGPRVEHNWGTKRFAWFYVLCGLGGVGFQMLFIRGGTLIGSSSAVFGVMTAYAMQWPDDDVYAFFLAPMRVRTFVMALVVLNLALGVAGTSDGTNVAYFAHLGGVLVAYAYLRLATSTAMDQVRQRVANLPDVDEPPRAIPRNQPRRDRGDEVDDVVAKSKAIAAKRLAAVTPSSPRRREARADELNRVLDKISEQGIDSLTTDERRLLEELSKRLRDR